MNCDDSQYFYRGKWVQLRYKGGFFQCWKFIILPQMGQTEKNMLIQYVLDLMLPNSFIHFLQ